MRFHISLLHDFPDAGNGACCMGAAMRGPGGCTCWEPKHDRRQSRQLREGPPAIRASMCEDCAFRKNSPERQGDERFALSSEGEIDQMVANPGAVFYCHQGMRKVLVHRHPSGAEVPGAPGEYDPPTSGALAYKANGNPADICAGFAACRRASNG